MAPQYEAVALGGVELLGLAYYILEHRWIGCNALGHIQGVYECSIFDACEIGSGSGIGAIDVDNQVLKVGEFTRTFLHLL